MLKTMIRSQHIGTLIAAASLALPAAHAQVALTFDTDTQGVVKGDHGTSMVWSDYGGGCLALTAASGWAAQIAYIDLNDAAFTDLKAEFVEALANGGTLSYKIVLETDGVVPPDPDPAPQWFESVYIGNSAAGWEQLVGGSKGQLGLGGGSFPLQAPVTVNVSYPIEAASSTVDDLIAQFNPSSTYFQIHLGLNTQPDSVESVTIYIDDFTITANETPEPPTIPRLTITPAPPGLNAITGGGDYARQCFRTTDPTNLSWVGVATPENPVSYELTISDYPEDNWPETVVYLVPGSEIENTVNNPDWTEPVCAGLWIVRNADGSGWASLRYKDYMANSNGPTDPEDHQYWVDDPAPSHGLGGQLGGVYGTNFFGTWKLTFTSDADCTLTAPDGTTSALAFNPATVAKFDGPMYVYFGNVIGTNPMQFLNPGAVYSRAKITGTAGDIDEDLTTTPYSEALEVAASTPAAVIQVLPDAARYWLDWTLPATDYQLQQSMDLGGSYPWEEMTMTEAFKVRDGMRRLLRLDEVYDAGVSFFRLEKPALP